jgi:steroid delta-isomerase-like uncharacterized protein
MSTDANKAIIRRYIEQLNGRNDAVIDELVAADVIVSTLHALSADASRPSVGRDVVRQGYRRNITAFPDYQVTVEQLIAEGDLVVMHWTHRGTHTGDFLGVPATGREIRGAAISIYHIVDGTIAEMQALWDQAEIWQQLGLIPNTKTSLSNAPLSVTEASSFGSDR